MSPFEPTESPKKMPKETDSSGKDRGEKLLALRKKYQPLEENTSCVKKGLAVGEKIEAV